MSVVATSALVGRRTCAVLAACSAGLHAAVLAHVANLATGVLMAVMIVACLYCARDLWLHGTVRAWCVVALMNLGMIAVHLPAPTHHHGTSATTAAGQQPTTMTLATMLAAVEVALAVAVLYYRTRRGVEMIHRN
jgi:hypothetical protein